MFATEYPDKLQEARMRLVEDSHCAMNEDILGAGILEEAIMQCAGFDHGHVTVCNVRRQFFPDYVDL